MCRRVGACGGITVNLSRYGGGYVLIYFIKYVPAAHTVISPKALNASPMQLSAQLIKEVISAFVSNGETCKPFVIGVDAQW